MTTDALGRLVEVIEDPGGLDSPRSRYCYDGDAYDMTSEQCEEASPPIDYAARVTR